MTRVVSQACRAVSDDRKRQDLIHTVYGRVAGRSWGGPACFEAATAIAVTKGMVRLVGSLRKLKEEISERRHTMRHRAFYASGGKRAETKRKAR